jgi:hypothetical protein
MRLASLQYSICRLACGVIFLAGVSAAQAAPPSKVEYNRDVRPILSENCFYCHGQDPNKRKADLRLDLRYGALKTGAIVPGKTAESGLVERISSADAGEQMPPPDSHRMLTAAQKETLTRWIAQGAEYQQHWAYVAPVRPPVPSVKQTNWARNPIDAFVLARLEAEGIAPSPEADRATLLRRVTLDLTGLPPTDSEIDAFLADKSPDAYERVVDRLLASPAYGERMAIPWLDAARYADSNGFQQDGDTYQWIWRDWVVKAINDDMPFNRFSIEQLAGDLLPNATLDQKIASAFNRNHLLNGEGGAIAEEQRFNILFDRVDTTATNWLGLTMACAQCHDHKYDPITQRDYYGLMAAFNNVPENGLAGPGPSRMRIAEPFVRAPSKESEKRLAEMRAELEKLEGQAKLNEKLDRDFAEWRKTLAKNAKGLPMSLSNLLETPNRSEQQENDLTRGLREYYETKVWPDTLVYDKRTKKIVDMSTKIKRYEAEAFPRVMVMSDAKPRVTHILERGSYEKPTVAVTFATPTFLPPQAPGEPKNRLGFAQWLFQPDQPLTARVQVNRFWQTFFGAGLVKTSEDFGVQSEMPVERDLIDWLAVEFRVPTVRDAVGDRAETSGTGLTPWSMKHIVRLIVTSATYRQTSRVAPDLLARDPENRLLARAARFRLPSMVLRDLALSASGLLDRRIGGEPVYPYQPEGIWETLAITHERDFSYPQSHGNDLYRRSLYTFWRRTVGPADLFDASSRQTCRVRCAVTCTPLHALTTLNDVVWVEASRVLAEHAIVASPKADARLAFAYRRILGRAPDDRELAMLRSMLTRQKDFYRRDKKAAAALCSTGQAPRNGKLDPAEHASLTAVCLALFNIDQALSHE